MTEQTKTTKQKQEPIFFDEQQFEAGKERLERIESSLNELMGEIHNLGLKVKTSGELYNLVRRTLDKGEKPIIKMFQEQIEPLKVGDVPLRPKETVELMDLPDLNPFLQKVYDVRATCQDKLQQIERSFEVAEDGKVNLLQSAIDHLKEFYSAKPRNKEEREFFAALYDAAKALDKAHKAGQKVNFPLFRHDRTFREHNLNKCFTANGDGVKVKGEAFYRIAGKM